jgi:hypothetical protein
MQVRLLAVWSPTVAASDIYPNYDVLPVLLMTTVNLGASIEYLGSSTNISRTVYSNIYHPVYRVSMAFYMSIYTKLQPSTACLPICLPSCLQPSTSNLLDIYSVNYHKCYRYLEINYDKYYRRLAELLQPTRYTSIALYQKFYKLSMQGLPIELSPIYVPTMKKARKHLGTSYRTSMGSLEEV